MAQTETHHILPAPIFDTPTRVLIVVSPYYKDIADNLVAGAKTAITASGASFDMIEVPGALEIPTAIKLASNAYDGFVALGCIIRGETTHYDTVCNDSSRALSVMGLDRICIGNGILTVENREQAVVRADHTGQNKGGGAADAAMHLIAIKRRFTKDGAGRIAPTSEHTLMADNAVGDQGTT
jgi:6,7-dimethyl-8-ribityllumazine synthase